MPAPANIKPGHKSLKAYYETLLSLGAQRVDHELALRSAFQNLLADTARAHGWTLVPELESHAAGHRIRPDGTLRDANSLPRGYWKAKDSRDDLPAEIRRKAALGYSLTNTIFEDTRRAILYQDGVPRFEAALADPQALADLLNQFYAHVEPNIASFEEAVTQFKERVPDLARGLAEKIAQAHRDNARFQSAFADFFTLCQSALNPNIAQAAVDEMLVQHLLTERLMRRIFDNEDFTRKNAIAVEIEKVIDALVSRSFSRADFLKSLDRFYLAIEGAARTLTDFADKQHFLNTVYERFFQGYSVRLADTHGIVYTPQPIVDFMCASVVEVLKEEFGKSLGDPGVFVIDPCTGTCNFIVNLLMRVSGRNLKRAYREQFFANEIMLLPYYIATLNIEHAYYERTQEYEPFEGMCFVDTLDLTESVQTDLIEMLTKKNTERVKRQKRIPINIVIGNPPYNAWQQNENDNNKNKKYKEIDDRIKESYAKDSTATNKNALSDMYVKFFRWAVDRLGGRDGIVCFISNNSFVDQIAFDGMRKHLLRDFTKIYHLDLHGNVRKNPKLSGTTHNVFGIQVGVGITIAIRRKNRQESGLFLSRVPENWRKEEKYKFLIEAKSLKGVAWESITPDERNSWNIPRNKAEFSSFIPLGKKSLSALEIINARSVFKVFSCGVKTNRDEMVYDFNIEYLASNINNFIANYNAELERYSKVKNKDLVKIDDFVNPDKVKWSETLKNKLIRGYRSKYDKNKLRVGIYRPFTKKFLYFDSLFNERRYQIPIIFPSKASEGENYLICLSGLGCSKSFQTLVVDKLPCFDFIEKARCFSFFVYDEDGSNRRENITDWALDQFRKHYKNKKIEKWDVFYYVYGVLHHPGYREKFADNLKRELPRIPFAPGFAAFAAAGRALADLHLNYESLEPHPLAILENPAVPFSWLVQDKMRLTKDKTALVVNPSLTLQGIPAAAFGYRLGNRSALEWVIDQYQLKEDPRSGIRSDPNREGDPEYIVRLVGQVIRVSLETVRIVAALPPAFTAE